MIFFWTDPYQPTSGLPSHLPPLDFYSRGIPVYQSYYARKANWAQSRINNVKVGLFVLEVGQNSLKKGVLLLFLKGGKDK